MKNKLSIALIPLDNRPVSYTLPKEIVSLNSSIQLHIPPKELLGALQKSANSDKIFSWLKKLKKIDFIICSLDTLFYGGLIPSRRKPLDFSTLENSLLKFQNIISSFENKPKIFAFSSIMRISNNNINEEEKDYWSLYGKNIFDYSYFTHKSKHSNDTATKEIADKLKKNIPIEVLSDYLKTRNKNFKFNKKLLSLVESKIIDYLIYSQDDTAEYGFNVEEAESLQKLINKKNIQKKTCVKTGADEILSNLISKAITEFYNEKIFIKVIWSYPNNTNLVSRYEDKTIKEVVKDQIEINGATLTEKEEEADLILFIHNFYNTQNDLALGILKEKRELKPIKTILKTLNTSKKPVLIADIANANGADNLLIKELLKNNLLNNVYSYSGWNTSSNTLGSCIATGMSKYIAQKQKTFDSLKAQQLFLTRLLDDWAYQANVRQILRSKKPDVDNTMLNTLMKDYYRLLASNINYNDKDPSFSFPWNRTFEIEINF